MSENGVVRVAVEGCGHGTLHAIYASIQASCEVNGWPGVDLVIIGGDFQAVRNQCDLNVTAMPQRFRKMADFHEYYSGTRTAPFLTIFIGGNHEASNHLFETYYGGWVAPNIYYLGAANVLRFGPLKIAGLSGIWKGYDYRKPHFERLPYNEEELQSIYHVREIDVRKLLSFRSQVDIGLSHDWPQGIEWHGDIEGLFRFKPFFREDAESGKLGSVAARQCLDRLRPPYWFSAHLHSRYEAVVHHGEYEGARNLTQQGKPRLSSFMGSKGAVENRDSSAFLASQNSETVPETSGKLKPRTSPTKQPSDDQRILGWTAFHASAQQVEAVERERMLSEQEQRSELRKNGITDLPQLEFEEEFIQVERDDGFGRKTHPRKPKSASPDDGPAPIPQYDGCSFSLPVKRHRNPDEISISDEDEPKQPIIRRAQFDGPASTSTIPLVNGSVKDPNAIDIDDSDEENDTTDATVSSSLNLQAAPGEPRPHQTQASVGSQDPVGDHSVHSHNRLSQYHPGAAAFVSGSGVSSLRSISIHSTASSQTADLNAGAAGYEPRTDTLSMNRTISLRDSPSRLAQHMDPPTTAQTNGLVAENAMAGGGSVKEGGATDAGSELNVVTEYDVAEYKGAEPNGKSNDVTEEMRAELAALSSKFVEPEKVKVSPPLPLPETISNKTTQFLALSKCEPNMEFLQLLEIEPLTPLNEPVQRPMTLQYDPEWLAIQRVFAPELELGGSPSDPVPQHRGDTYYRDRIIEEEKWVQEHIVEPGLLQVPENFSITAPVYDPNLVVGPKEMPREVTNPQTVEFCKLIGIENKFDLSEEERNEMMEQGPRAASAFFANKPRGRGGFRSGRGSSGSNNRGGRGGGFRGGRGRGRGRH